MDGASGTCTSYVKWTATDLTTKPGSSLLDTVTWSCVEWVGKSKTSYSRGSSLNKTVSSNKRNAYPDNNYSGNTWYVYKGIY